MKDVRDVEVRGKRILLRADLDVPLKDGKVADDARIKAAIPTIRYLPDHGAKVIVAAHLDRPGGRVVEGLRMDPVAKELSRYLVAVHKVNDCMGATVRKAAEQVEEGDILLLENLRFHLGEEENDPEFAKELASLADLYVNDCFSTSHRAHASICGVPKFLPAFAGFALLKEVKLLRKFLAKLKHPLVVILGGAKKDKLSLLPDFLEIADFVLVGGKLARWKKENDRKAPSTLVVGRGKDDIDGGTVRKFAGVIKTARSVVWSGPMGKFEEGFIEGTRAVAKAVVKSRARSIVGGGDTEAILDKLGLIGKIGYVSPAGGAMLAFLAGRKLPGLEALNFYS